MGQTFRKEERLCSKKIIEALFESGSSLSVHPLRLVWIETKLKTKYPVQITISVPKKNIAKAAERNKIKRQMREVYRKNKNILYEYLYKGNKQYAMALIFTANSKIEYKEIESKIILTLQRFIEINEKRIDTKNTK